MTLHASTQIVFLDTDWQEQLRRKDCRAGTVPEKAICDMMDELVLSETQEAHHIEWLCV